MKNITTTIKAMTTAAALTAATTATAGTAPFSMVSGVNPGGIDVSLTVQASSNPDYAYDFIVSNNSADGIVTGVFFEEGWNTKLAGAGTGSGPAVLLPGSQSPGVSPWGASKSSHTVGSMIVRSWISPRAYRDSIVEKIDDGIHAGQSQVFSFKTDTSVVSLQDLEDVLGDERFGVAIKMQDLTEDRTAAGWGLVNGISNEIALIGPGVEVQEGGDKDVTGAPTPTAALTGLAMIGILGLRRRRNNA